MTAEQMAKGCPNRIGQRRRFHCKALIGQPNGSVCDPNNCASLYIADLMINELRAEILGGKDEDATSTPAAARAVEG